MYTSLFTFYLLVLNILCYIRLVYICNGDVFALHFFFRQLRLLFLCSRACPWHFGGIAESNLGLYPHSDLIAYIYICLLFFSHIFSVATESRHLQ